MKKILLVFVFCALMLLPTVMAETEEVYTAPEPGAPMTLEGDMGLLIKDVWYPLLTDFAPLKEALGEPASMVAAPSCVFKGEDKEFAYDGMSIYTNPLGEVDVWFEAYILGEGYVTARGIGIGAAFEDVIAAYGEDYYTEGENMITYSVSGDEEDYESPCIIFTLTDEVVTCIDIYFPTNTL